MYSIYCIVDPRDGKPFYVGATRQSILTRLGGHLCELNTYGREFWSDKMKMINDILIAKRKPKVKLLCTCEIHDVDHYERFFYNMLVTQGYQLLQKPTAFCYSKTDKTMTQKANNHYNKNKCNAIAIINNDK